MPPNVLSPSKRLIVRKVCVVGSCKDSAAIDLLQTEYNAEVVYSTDGQDYIDKLDDYIFLVEDFYSQVFIRLHREPGTRVMSPTYVRSRYRRQHELVAPRPNRPLYCELLKDKTLVMSNMPNKSDIANMAHFLGARIRKDVIEHSTHVIATSVNCKQYRAAFSMGLPILRPDYVQYMWDHKRDELDFDIMNAELLHSYRLQAFEGLKISFIAFTGEEMIDMENQVKKYKGEVVRDDRLATHVVFNAKGTDLPKVEMQQGQNHLTSEWLWQSVQMEGRADEDNYIMKPIPTKKTSRSVFSPMTTSQPNSRQTRSSSNVLDTSNSSVLTNGLAEYSTDDLDKMGVPSPKRIDKRHQVCQEMLETEQNYIKALELVIKFKDALEADLSKGGDGMVKKEDIVIIFSKFNKIIQVHNKILEKLEKLVQDWRPENEVGKAWIDAKEELLAAYPPFINSFDTIKGTLDNLDMTNQRFHVFLKAQESSPEFRRNTMRDLIIRPVQRLPSVMLLLKEIEKRTDSRLADKESLKIAEQVITSVLKKANGRRQMNDEFLKIFQLWNQIADVPPHLYKATRGHVMDLEMVSVGGTGLWKRYAKRTLRFFLFNDILEITKVRRFKEPVNKMGRLSRLTRNLTVSNRKNLSSETRPYKHVNDVLLTSLRQMYYVYAGDTQLLVLVIRGETEADEELVLQPPDGGDSRLGKQFVVKLCANVYTQCGRDIAPSRVEMHDTSGTVNEIARKILYKGRESRFKRNRRRGSANSPMMDRSNGEMDESMPLGNTTNTSFSRGGGFRRALSNASLTISKKFHMSRPNLRSISEQESTPGFIPLSGDALSIASSSMSPDNSREVGPSDTPPSRYIQRQTSLRSLFSFTSRSSIKRRDSETGKENSTENIDTPPPISYRFSTQF